MQLNRLDHVNIRTHQLDTLADWYERVLGMHSGNRPDFPFPGAWLYIGDSAVVHLVGIDDGPATGSEVELKLEHFALSATGRSEFEQRLTALGEKFDCTDVPGFNIIQYNIWDPDGNHIHIDFAADEP